jgi:hypothetical protein
MTPPKVNNPTIIDTKGSEKEENPKSTKAGL